MNLYSLPVVESNDLPPAPEIILGDMSAYITKSQLTIECDDEWCEKMWFAYVGMFEFCIPGFIDTHCVVLEYVRSNYGNNENKLTLVICESKYAIRAMERKFLDGAGTEKTNGFLTPRPI